MHPSLSLSLPADLRVLLIESDAVAPTQRLLEASGASVLRARQIKQCEEFLRQHEVFLAVVNMNTVLDGQDSLNFVKQLREKQTHLPFLFLANTPEDIERVLDSGLEALVDVMAASPDVRLLHRKVALFAQLAQARQKLRAQNDAFQREQQLNAMMIAALTHDLRTPMTAVELSSEIVLKRSENESITKAAARIKSSVARMVSTIQHLLSVSKLGRERIPIHPEPNDFRDIALEVLNEFQAAKPDASIQFDTAGDTQAAFDSHRMAQVLSNLVGVAVEYGGATTPVAIKIDGSHRSHVQINVSTPAVFSETVRASLFAPTTHPGTRPASGIGLGLSIVEQLVRAHAGTLVAVSDARTGTMFEVRIPRTEGTSLEETTQ